MSRPPSPILGKGYFSAPFERFVRDDRFDQLAGAFTLLDTIETYFDSHVDLLQRKLQKHSDKLKMAAEEAFKDLKIRELSGDLLAENFEREFKTFKVKLSTRITSLAASWQSAKVIRTREKVSFFLGVMNLVFSTLICSSAPQWVHIAYTVQGFYLISLRAYIYKKRDWHYFLFDFCYFVTILNFVFLWIFPSSPTLFVACYCLSHGALASSVITWRNSLVFHDLDKVTSLFIHIYAPLSFTVIRHFYPNAEERFPALREVPTLNPLPALILTSGIFLIWQLLYWKFVLVDRRAKIQSGERTTSFSWLLNDKRGAVGRVLSAVPAESRMAYFVSGQFIYSIITEIPAVFLLYGSSTWSVIFLLFILCVSVWNGSGFYIEVFGRKFERELETLRKEIAESAARNSGLDTPNASDLSRNQSHSDLTSFLQNGVSSSSSNGDASPRESKKDL